ncbi:MAG: acetyl-CoA carboxylase biotin carboxyl carrier protein [Acidobacteriaceae bacterium]|nr:acetyl-CoA carboxylase biotin carboxyl carrier protein [Acidobacteriaceae bacterium]MBV9498707.1 acetyl-CoA carboxylase biotin carboxyl carrier protein [Acidobacteriaceae bacterium]
MTIDEIKQLIQLVRESGIFELEVKDGDNSVRIRSAATPNLDVVAPAVLPISIAAPAVLPTPPAPAPLPQEATSVPTPAPAKESEADVVVKAPIVGTYYDAPGPGAAPFVRVGDRVEPKQVLCIIESMKLMNEIEAELAGTVVAKHVENGRPVEYGESLFTIHPI